MIRISPVRLVGPDNEQIGVVETQDALRMAQEQGLDLVEVVADSRPPVCKIMDYGKYRYELSQKERKTRASSKTTELKEIRLGRSIKIDPHDVQIRIDQARRFLMEGHKVQFTQRFKGREIAHRHLGMDNLREIVDALEDIAKVEVPPRQLGRAVSIVLAPDRNKIDAIKRKLAKEEEAREAESSEIELEKSAARSESKSEKPKTKGAKDERAVNPVDDEIADLLGG